MNSPTVYFLTSPWRGGKQYNCPGGKQKIKLINPKVKIDTFKVRIEKKNIEKIFKDYDFIVDGSDNFKTKFILNKY